METIDLILIVILSELSGVLIGMILANELKEWGKTKSKTEAK